MYESPFPDIKPDVRHFSFDIEEQNVTFLEPWRRNSLERFPKTTGRSRQPFSSIGVGILHEAATVEAGGIGPAVGIGNSNLPHRDRSRLRTGCGELMRAAERLPGRRLLLWSPCSGTGAKQYGDRKQAGDLAKICGWR